MKKEQQEQTQESQSLEVPRGYVFQSSVQKPQHKGTDHPPRCNRVWIWDSNKTSLQRHKIYPFLVEIYMTRHAFRNRKGW